MAEREGEGAKRSLNVVLDATLPTPPSAFPLRSEPLWLPAGVLAVLFMLSMAINAAGAEPPTGRSRVKMQWRPAGVSTTVKARTHRTRTTRERVASRKSVSRGVRLVGYDDDLYAAPRSTDESGAARLHSVVVNSSLPEGSNFRVAQTDDPDFGSALERQLIEPFGSEELPPQEEDPFDTDTLPEPDDIDPLDDMGDLGDGQDSLAAPGFDDEPAQTLPPVDDFSPLDPDEDLLDNDPLDDDFSPSDDKEEDQAKQRSAAAQDCAEALAELKASRLATVDIHIGVAGVEGKDYPHVCSIEDGSPFPGRCWAPVTYMWKASALCHKPLYFEQKAVERYGHSMGPYLDPIYAGAHFFTRLPVLPYCMGLKAPNECVYALGHYRPGSCAPYLVETPPFTCRAAAFQASAWTGGMFLIP